LIQASKSVKETPSPTIRNKKQRTKSGKSALQGSAGNKWVSENDLLNVALNHQERWVKYDFDLKSWRGGRTCERGASVAIFREEGSTKAQDNKEAQSQLYPQETSRKRTPGGGNCERGGGRVNYLHKYRKGKRTVKEMIPEGNCRPVVWGGGGG